MAGRGQSRRRRALAAGAAAAVCVTVTVAAAQDGPGGKSLRLTLGQSLEYSDNIDLVADPDNDTLRSSTRVGLVYSDITRTQDFRLSAGGDYYVDTDGERGPGDLFARLAYALEGANSRLSFSADFARVDLEDALSNLALIPPGVDDLTDPLAGGEDPVAEIARIETGARIDSDYRFGFETGLQSPVGLRLNLAAQNRRYSQTTDPDLFDTDDRRLDALATFRIDPTVTARLAASARRYDAEDAEQTERREASLDAGVALRVTPILTVDVAAGYERIEVDRLGEATRRTEGARYTVAVDRDLPNGTVGLDFASVPTLNGRRNTLRADRAMDLPRGATLAYGIGVTKTEGLSAEPLFSLAYGRPLKLGSFGFEFSQEARTGEEDDDAVILSRLSATYATALSPTVDWTVNAGLSDVSARQPGGEDRRRVDLRTDLRGQITPVSSWSAGLTFSETETNEGLAGDRQRRYGVQLSYRRELAREWDMVARYQHTSILDTGAPDRRANAISLGLEKAFDFRP